MLLSKKDILKNASNWRDKNIDLPAFDLEKVIDNTKENPMWVHFGAGNIFRGYVSKLQQILLDDNLSDRGIIAVESFDFEIIDKIYKAYDNLTLLVTMHADGRFEKKVLASITESLKADVKDEIDFLRLREIFENPGLQMVSLTITEKGYSLKDTQGEYLDIINRDIEKGPSDAIHTMSILAALLYNRFKAGAHPLTLVSMDNCSHNGDVLKASIIDMAKEWESKGFVEEEFIAYLEDEDKVSYPLTMIDKITPRPAESVQNNLEAEGIADMDILVTDKNTYIAPFVNAESSEYLVIEDKFTNGRPALEKAGVIFTDRDTVNKVETMKVTTCLNPLHTAIATTGSLLGHELIAHVMEDPSLRRLAERVGYDEGLKVVVDPGIIDPKAFIDEVINERFSNANIPDTPQRIATDTSQKVGIRFGETIKAYLASEDLDVKDLFGIPLAIAGWCRYLIGIDDEGEAYEVSPDPLKEELEKILKDVKLGSKSSNVSEILSNESIFGLNLYDAGLGERIEKMFYEMLDGPGAVRRTLDRYLK